MPLEFTKAERIDLKSHPDFSEKWLQERIVDDLKILGLKDVLLVTAEKPQPKAGRLDLLLHDDQLERRYEVELMLGKTNPDHIIRCLEYWDIERRRYPAYEHVAVLVAEDITSRFLNIIGLLAGSIPLVAIQLVALKVEDKIALHFVHVLDQTALRTDDTFENDGGSAGPTTTDRAYWEGEVSPQVLNQCDEVRSLAQEITSEPYSLQYRKILIDVLPENNGHSKIWLLPKKTLVRVGGYVSEPEEWVHRFDEIGLIASLRRGNKAVIVSFKPDEMKTHDEILRKFLGEALNVDGGSEE